MAPVRRRAVQTEVRARHASPFSSCVALLFALVLGLGPGCREPEAETVEPVDLGGAVAREPAPTSSVEALRVRVIQSYPHDPGAFTQGLIWHQGLIYESTGQYGRSTLRRVRLEDGKVLAQRDLAPELFGEGLALVDNRLVQLTWRSGLALVADLATLQEQHTFRYQGEGWGLCYDGTELVMSDGSSTLTFRDPESMELIRELTVSKNGQPVPRLNELECVGPEVYANIWQRDEIVRIDSGTGRVTASIDASGLLSRLQALRANVLNGIAYKPDSKTFLLTGKNWPQVFEVELVPR